MPGTPPPPPPRVTEPLLKHIDPANVKNLELKWILPNRFFGALQSSPLVVDGLIT